MRIFPKAVPGNFSTRTFRISIGMVMSLALKVPEFVLVAAATAQLWSNHVNTSTRVGFMMGCPDSTVIAVTLTFSENVSDEILLKRIELTRQLHDINQMEARDYVQKSKIKSAIEGDENLKFFHGIINKKRSQLSIRGGFVDDDWNTDPEVVKDVFKDHFATRFKQHIHGPLKLNISFHNRLSTDQFTDMDRSVSQDEIRVAVWNYGENKSPGPDGYTFEFFTRYWRFIGSDFCSAVECFFESRATSDGLFKGIQIQGSMAISHLFYADDAVFIGEWSDFNLDDIVKILKCFFLTLGLKNNIQKSQVLGVGVPRNIVNQAASLIGCAFMQNPFRYLGVMVGDPERKITWVYWDKVLASKKNGGLGVSSFHALNHALLFNWVWRFLSQDGSLWFCVIQALYGSVTLPAYKDRWICDLNGDGVFRVKEINVFAWCARLDRLSTRYNLVRRGVVLDSSLCPLCGFVPEDIHHVLFRCDTAKLVFHRICHWWDPDWHDLFSFLNWNALFSAIRHPSRIKLILE
uniref:RNA-directed DNA polymerase, eukaryota n=1 Tax=Tanacetum cinerariifolium TaxID=118510 RepID=A0A6L2JSR3_TANCI|nr:RNA-directed DNA polymerase, eukaryota [Tanacetum cinerariifolium]